MTGGLRQLGRMSATISDLVVAYYGSRAFECLSVRTRRDYSRILERLCSGHGLISVAEFGRRDVLAILAAQAHAPSKANLTLRLLRALMRCAVDLGWRGDDPTEGVKPLRTPVREPVQWSEEDIRRFEERHPPGSDARRALSLMLHGGLWPSQAVTVGPRHVDGDCIVVRRRYNGAASYLPLHPALKEELDRAPKATGIFLVTPDGEPFTSAGFCRWFHDRCNEAGLPHRSSRGLRHAGARRLAEAGCSMHEIAAWAGNKTLMDPERLFTPEGRARRVAEKLRKLLR